MTINNVKFSGDLKEALKRNGLKKNQLCINCSISEPTLWRLEKGLIQRSNVLYVLCDHVGLQYKDYIIK